MPDLTQIKLRTLENEKKTLTQAITDAEKAHAATVKGWKERIAKIEAEIEALDPKTAKTAKAAKPSTEEGK